MAPKEISVSPPLIQNVLMANANGVLVTHGLMGTQGTYYGPLATWVYQAYLAISLNLVLLVLLRSLAMLTLTAGALWIIARSMQVRTVGFTVAVFSPFFWLYSRQIWDNSFCIPLAAWAVAGYCLFLTRKPRIGGGDLRAFMRGVAADPFDGSSAHCGHRVARHSDPVCETAASPMVGDCRNCGDCRHWFRLLASTDLGAKERAAAADAGS